MDDHKVDSQKYVNLKITDEESVICSGIRDLQPSDEIGENKQPLLMDIPGSIASTLKMFKKFAFWSTQPMVQKDEYVTSNRCITPKRRAAEIRAEPYALPIGFMWVLVDLANNIELEELYKLLNENYVEDGRKLFRLDNQPDFLKWALKPPGWKSDWHVGVRVETTGQLVAFISAIPGKLRCYNKVIKVVDVNFMCVHKRLRGKRVAPILMREITRRVNLKGIFQAFFTAGVHLPTPVGSCRCWHRFLNPQKLVEVRYTPMSRNLTVQHALQLYSLPNETKTKGFRPIREEDMDQAHKLLEKYLTRFKLCPVFSKDEFSHWFTPKPGVIECFVVTDAKNQVTDLASYLCLPSTVIQHAKHKTISAANAFYNVATKTSWSDLLNDTMISARNNQMDVFNTLEQMEIKKHLATLKFVPGDGMQHYYLFNWRCPPMEPQHIALTPL
ncbi:glycylpeptide N-tetradecanoyltransferase-like [Drosophila rhopaloa]|uniref:Glycylpeptide N-tetradecanoyltransferase n=1 Tax=Drosophila rhopaloa TaxID=1041015 RepID=A0A6P4FBD9_DRORH|nr:glycylpeptide N-tetradecanoyltransferase-like [Drosophila rhopaloa]